MIYRCLLVFIFLASSLWAQKNIFLLKGLESWKSRHEKTGQKAREARFFFLEAVKQTNFQDYEILCYSAYASNFLAKFFEKEKKEKEKLYLEAIEYSQKALHLEKEGIEAYLLLGIAYAELAELNNSLSYAKKAKIVFEWIEKKNPSLQEGFACMVLGRLYHQAPGWPISFGDNQIAKNYFEKALAISKNLRFTYLYYADLLQDIGKKEEALSFLQQGFILPIQQDKLTEENYCLEEMRKLEKKIREK